MVNVGYEMTKSIDPDLEYRIRGEKMMGIHEFGVGCKEKSKLKNDSLVNGYIF